MTHCCYLSANMLSAIFKENQLLSLEDVSTSQLITWLPYPHFPSDAFVAAPLQQFLLYFVVFWDVVTHLIFTHPH